VKALAAAAAVLAALWLGAWAADRGVLVWSEQTRLGTRTCSYLIGVSVVKRIGNILSDRCALITRV
jgi:hypothetical protein